MERLKKQNQTMLAVVGFLTAIIPALRLRKNYITATIWSYIPHWFLHSQGVIAFLILETKFADKYAVRYFLIVFTD